VNWRPSPKSTSSTYWPDQSGDKTLLPSFPGMSPMTLPLSRRVSDLGDIHQRAQSDTTPRVIKGSQSSIHSRRYEHHPLEEHREWLRQGTTCYVVDSTAFLETFLPEVAQTHVDRVHSLLLIRKLLTPQGWREFSGGTIAKVGEHHMFSEPLEEIVNQTIAILAGDEGLTRESISGELRLHDVQGGGSFIYNSSRLRNFDSASGLLSDLSPE
jgi:hypothetical protein